MLTRHSSRNRRRGGLSISNATITDITGTTVTITFNTGVALTTSDTIGLNYAVGTRAGMSALDPGAGPTANTAAAAGTSQSMALDLSAGGLVSTAGDANNNCAAIEIYVQLSGSASPDATSSSFTTVAVNVAADFSTEAQGDTFTYSHGVIIGPSGTNPTRKWYRGASSPATTVISGETAETYVATAADVDNYVTVRLLDTDGTTALDTDTTTGLVTSGAEYLIPGAYLNVVSGQYLTPYGYVNA